MKAVRLRKDCIVVVLLHKVPIFPPLCMSEREIGREREREREREKGKYLYILLVSFIYIFRRCMCIR